MCGAGSRRRRAAPARGAARARCAAGRRRARPCRAAARGRRASGTSTSRCSRPRGTRRAARPCRHRVRAEVATPPLDRRRDASAAPRAACRRAGIDSPPAPETARTKFASDISSSPWKMLSAQRGDEAQSGPAGRRARRRSRRRALGAARRSSSSRRRSPGPRRPQSRVQQQPRVRALGVGRRQRALKREAAGGDERAAATPRMRGFVGSIQVQAARIVAWQHAERHRLRSSDRSRQGRAPRGRRALFGSCTIGSSRSTSSG